MPRAWVEHSLCHSPAYDGQHRPGRWRSVPKRVAAGGARSGRRVVGPPMLGDGGPVAEPHALMSLDVLDEARQRSNPAGATDDAAVKADAHPARSPLLSQAVQPVQ